MNEKRPGFCHLCGEKLHGSYLVYSNGLVVCERCNRSVPHCSQCNLPSRQLTTARGVQICPACRQKAPICACCREPILGRYFLVGDSPLRYCEVCMNTRPRCDICRAPLDDQGKIFQGRDGKAYRCSTCFSTVVNDPAEAMHLYNETYLLLSKALQLEIAVLPKLSLVERARMIELHQQAGILAGIASTNIPLGPEHQHLLGFFQSVGIDQTIYIEQLLPQTLFRAVAAHELAHSWQSTHAPQGQAAKIVEGFAEWVAYRTLLLLGHQGAAARLTRRNDLYGVGLQYFIALERQQGQQAVLQRASRM